MRAFSSSLFALTLAFILSTKVMAYACVPEQAAPHDCCEKPAPVAPKAACPVMVCCRVLPATAAPPIQLNNLVFVLPPAVLMAQPLGSWYAVPAFSDSGPPRPRTLSVSDRSPPTLLG